MNGLFSIAVLAGLYIIMKNNVNKYKKLLKFIKPIGNL